jgi:tetratricopeptide (TPR) repeat protein
MAQYNVGIVLKEREEYDEAIAEFFKLLSSNVDDRDPGADIMEAYRNYRHKAALRISECYEGKHDFRRAIEYALLARDKHQYHTWCGTCAKSAEDALTKRIERLELLAKSRK